MALVASRDGLTLSRHIALTTDAVMAKGQHMCRKTGTLVACATVVFVMSVRASAGPIYGFHKTSNNGGVEVAQWLSVEVSNGGTVGSTHYADFTFRYAALAAPAAGAGSFIDGVYF